MQCQSVICHRSDEDLHIIGCYCDMTKKNKQEAMAIDNWSYTAGNSIAEIKHRKTKDQ